MQSARAQLDAAEINPATEHIWAWFFELRSSVPDGFSRSPISFQEIDAWIRCTGLDPRPWEVRALRAMDLEFHRYHRERSEKDRGKVDA